MSTKQHQAEKKLAHHPYRTIGQMVGTVVSIFALLFIIGEGIPDVMKGKGLDLIPFLPLLLVATAGFILSFFNEKLGAFTMLIGGLLLVLFFLFKTEQYISLVYGAIFGFTALMFLLHLKQLDHSIKKAT